MFAVSLIPIIVAFVGVLATKRAFESCIAGIVTASAFFIMLPKILKKRKTLLDGQGDPSETAAVPPSE